MIPLMGRIAKRPTHPDPSELVMLSASEGRKQRKELDRQRTLALRHAAREKLRHFRAEVRQAKADVARKVKDARELCKRNKQHVRARARDRRRRLLEDLRATERAER